MESDISYVHGADRGVHSTRLACRQCNSKAKTSNSKQYYEHYNSISLKYFIKNMLYKTYT